MDRIVAAAIEIADAEGIQALSMARLAERLGSAPMSLYRHVANKEELQVFMMDTAPGQPPAIDFGSGDWRGGLERWARALQGVYYRHPWILQITSGRPPLRAGQLAWLDCGLRTLGSDEPSAGRKTGGHPAGPQLRPRRGTNRSVMLQAKAAPRGTTGKEKPGTRERWPGSSTPSVFQRWRRCPPRRLRPA